MYGTALQRAWESVRKNWVVSFAPFVYGFILSLAGQLAFPLGIVGGMIYTLVLQACLSSGLNLIRNMVESGKANFNDFLNGFTIYLWELIGIAFILWIPMRVLAGTLAGVPNGAVIYLLVEIGLYVLLNAVPELIYQSRVSGLELIGASYNFIVENWLEWLIPNIILAIGGYFLMQFFGGMTLLLPDWLQSFLDSLVFGLFLVWFMTFRGFLFPQLYGSTRRNRIYRYDVR